MKITPAITAKLADLEKQIKTDWKQFHSDFEEAATRADNAAMSGWQIGKALNEAKKLIPHGSFTIWFAKVGVPERTGQLFMAKAREYPTIKEFMKNRREAILATGLLPDKEQVNHPDNVNLPSPGTNHLQFFNRWSAWRHEVDAGKIKPDLAQTKEELRPMYDWMKKELYGE